MKLLIHANKESDLSELDFTLPEFEVRRVFGDASSIVGIQNSWNADFVLLLRPDLASQQLQAVIELLGQESSVNFLIYSESLSSEYLLQALRLGIREVVTPDSIANINQTLRRLNNRESSQKTRSISGLSGKKKIGFVSAKGGDGSSSILANFAKSLINLQNQNDRQSQKVLLLDLSMPFGDLDIYLTKEKIEHDISDFIKELERLDGSLVDVMVHKLADKFHLIKSPANFEDILNISPDEVAKFLNKLEAQYDLILVDLGSSIHPIILRVLLELDILYLIFSDSLQSARKVGQLMTLMNVIGFDSAKISVIINKQDKSSELSVSDYQSVIKHDINFILPNEVQNMRQSVLESKCIVDLDKKSKYSVAIVDWVTKFLNIESESEKSSIWQILKRK